MSYFSELQSWYKYLYLNFGNYYVSKIIITGGTYTPMSNTCHIIISLLKIGPPTSEVPHIIWMIIHGFKELFLASPPKLIKTPTWQPFETQLRPTIQAKVPQPKLHLKLKYSDRSEMLPTASYSERGNPPLSAEALCNRTKPIWPPSERGASFIAASPRRSST